MNPETCGAERPAWIALGANLGAREAQLREALRRLDSSPGIRVAAVSPFIETEPVGGPPGQPRYLNGAAELRTTLAPRKLLARMLEIEAGLGRDRSSGVRYGPRPVDLDLLLYAAEVIDEPDLTVPHPRLHERRFVLEPLAAIAPEALHPVLCKPVRELLAIVNCPAPRMVNNVRFKESARMRVIPFVKMSGTGNDFMMVDNREGLLKEGEAAQLARAACPRRTSAGADGVILIERATRAGHDYRMRIFNADGSEAEMCGNGSRCLTLFACQLGAAKQTQRIETLAGTLNAVAAPDGLSAKVQLSQPSKLEFKKGVPVLGQSCDLHFINTGVPHAILFVSDVTQPDVKAMGAAIRHHEVFKPKGTNANFVQLLGDSTIRIRTYERGVEDETFACGTGATAAAIVSGLVHGYRSPVKVLTQGQAVLTIHFQRTADGVEPPYLEGAVDTVYKGEFHWRT